MEHAALTTNDLIDGLVQDLFDVEPEVMASLAHDDEQVRRRRPGLPATTDPLDGLEVFVRRTVSACLALRRHAGAVSLLTERQAQAAGWPTARLANAALILAWGLFVETEPCLTMPLLLAADEHAKGPGNRILRVDPRLPALDTLLTRLRRGWHADAAALERVARARETAPSLEGRRIAVSQDVLRDWLGIDADAVDLQTDGRGPAMTTRGARAAYVIAWLACEALEMGRVMQAERVSAVRIKTEGDARLAGQPGARAGNLALLLGAAINHGSGYTVHFLPPREALASALIETGRQIGDDDRSRGADRDCGVVSLLELQDRAARGYVHVGRCAAGRVAQRLYDACTGRTTSLTAEATT